MNIIQVRIDGNANTEGRHSGYFNYEFGFESGRNLYNFPNNPDEDRSRDRRNYSVYPGEVKIIVKAPKAR